jgi:hypothetical protein
VAVQIPTPASIALRFGGSFLFVLFTGVLGACTLPDRFGVESIPGIVVLIILGFAHVYLLYRAYYPLRKIGIMTFSLVFALSSYYMMSVLELEASVDSMLWLLVVYPTLRYEFELSCNHIDSALSGLLHTKGIYTCFQHPRQPAPLRRSLS